MIHSKWNPAVDLYQTPQGWVVKFDLAGVGPTDVEVELDGRDLVIRGVRKDRMFREGWRHYSMEIQYDSFERVVRLPRGLPGGQVTHDFLDGMLVVQVHGKERGGHHE